MSHHQEIFIDAYGDNMEFKDTPFSMVLCAVLDDTLALRKEPPLFGASYSFKPYRLAEQSLFVAARRFVDSGTDWQEQTVKYRFLRLTQLGVMAMDAPYMNDNGEITPYTFLINKQFEPTIATFDDIANAATKIVN